MFPDPEEARLFAIQAHYEPYDGVLPYSYHLQQVVTNLQRFCNFQECARQDGFDGSIMLTAGWLHDVLEDTNRSYNDVKRLFGEEVAEIVYAVTSELGRNRRERNSRTYPKIKEIPSARIVKLADRIANVEYGIRVGSRMFNMYADEFPSFQDGVRDRDAESDLERVMWEFLSHISNYDGESKTSR